MQSRHSLLLMYLFFHSHCKQWKVLTQPLDSKSDICIVCAKESSVIATSAQLQRPLMHGAAFSSEPRSLTTVTSFTIWQRLFCVNPTAALQKQIYSHAHVQFIPSCSFSVLCFSLHFITWCHRERIQAVIKDSLLMRNGGRA